MWLPGFCAEGCRLEFALALQWMSVETRPYRHCLPLWPRELRLGPQLRSHAGLQCSSLHKVHRHSCYMGLKQPWGMSFQSPQLLSLPLIREDTTFLHEHDLVSHAGKSQRAVVPGFCRPQFCFQLVSPCQTGRYCFQSLSVCVPLALGVQWVCIHSDSLSAPSLGCAYGRPQEGPGPGHPPCR